MEKVRPVVVSDRLARAHGVSLATREAPVGHGERRCPLTMLAPLVGRGVILGGPDDLESLVRL